MQSGSWELGPSLGNGGVSTWPKSSRGSPSSPPPEASRRAVPGRELGGSLHLVGHMQGQEPIRCFRSLVFVPWALSEVWLPRACLSFGPKYMVQL